MGAAHPSQSSLLGVSRLFEQAAFEPETFGAACSACADLLDASFFHILAFTEGAPFVIGDERSQAFMQRYLSEAWWQVDELTLAAKSRKVQGFTLEQDLIADPLRKRSAIVHDFRTPLNAQWLAGWGFDIEAEHWGFAALRGNQGCFGPEYETIYAALAPSITTAAMFATKNQFARAIGMADLIERSDDAAVILDHRGRCIALSPAAEALFDDEFCVCDGKLSARDKDANRQLCALGAAAARSGPLAQIIISKRNGVKLLLAPLRVAGAGQDFLPGARIVVRILQLESRRMPDANALKVLYNLTPSEIRFVRLFATGLSLQEIADQFGIEHATARQHLKSIFAKTETHRQGELVALLARLTLERTA